MSRCPHRGIGGRISFLEVSGGCPPIPTCVPTRVPRALAALEAALALEEEEGDVPTLVLVEHQMVRPQTCPTKWT